MEVRIMSSSMRRLAEQQERVQKMQIYPTSNAGISPFWREKYEREAKKYWDIFYKRHGNRFFKDRHYLDKEWDSYFSVGGNKVMLEVGCGAGNTIFPLISTYPEIFVYACDFSPRAVELVKAHKEFTETRVCAFICDLTTDDLDKHISPSSVDIVTMMFVLSAVSPEKMPLVLQNIRKVLKPNGCVLFRDYATGDLAQERFTGKDQKISENFYVRGDGTRAFYFSNEFLTTLVQEQGFEVEELGVCCKQVENRSRELVMNRRWVQAVFRCSDIAASAKLQRSEAKMEPVTSEKLMEELDNNGDVDISEGVAIEMFGVSPSNHEMIEVKFMDSDFKIKLLSKEYQHTCKSTGLMLWESARLMAFVLDRNPSIVSAKRVLELGCGCSGICSMVAARAAENIATNLRSPLTEKLKTGVLEWGNEEQIQAVRGFSGEGFDVIIGTDVTYIPDAILMLFETARKLISQKKFGGEDSEKPALILCHVFRRVDEPSLISAASKFGFKLVDRWQEASETFLPARNIISPWFAHKASLEEIPSSALHILYFQME
ncbi:PREDICTED: LOW QUALITY PROTEIN: uncharacterized protein LOC104819893 [Tarenaya hassleriana]|uniref:LOW QUALITY PROTEIN: uncharacterized protein LOC104819893 n=1 Tax=Tarenaya hassleriana TaxID=28532 RepID=UPI0008FD7F06|nr:PREDICTED: LOW QUALITY PROTEIN: uncharacterized protein LOC104819893 [Tarenaya hassleriana]